MIWKLNVPEAGHHDDHGGRYGRRHYLQGCLPRAPLGCSASGVFSSSDDGQLDSGDSGPEAIVCIRRQRVRGS
jgi:hypothetical protein